MRTERSTESSVLHHNHALSAYMFSWAPGDSKQVLMIIMRSVNLIHVTRIAVILISTLWINNALYCILYQRCAKSKCPISELKVLLNLECVQNLPKDLLNQSIQSVNLKSNTSRSAKSKYHPISELKALLNKEHVKRSILLTTENLFYFLLFTERVVWSRARAFL